MCFFFQAEDGIRDKATLLEFRRVLFRSRSGPEEMSGGAMDFFSGENIIAMGGTLGATIGDGVIAFFQSEAFGIVLDTVVEAFKGFAGSIFTGIVSGIDKDYGGFGGMLDRKSVV